MSYLINTNIISEVVRHRPNKRVIEWLKNTPDEDLYISVLTIGEIRKGIEKLEISKRREQLRIWLEHDLPEWFGDRILPINIAVAECWGVISAKAQRTLPAIDALIAATAVYYDMHLVTRNDQDFDYPGLMVINPWKL